MTRLQACTYTMQVCADCGAVGAASIPCEGVPCRIAMEVQVQLADTLRGSSSHSWKMTDSYPPKGS